MPRMDTPPLPFNQALVVMIKTILREGGYVAMGYSRVVPRNGSGANEPIGNFKEICKRMAERGELIQYKPARDVGMAYVWGMRGITPDICKDRDELYTQLELMSHRVERLKSPRWISMTRHKPEHQQRIIAFVPILANTGNVGQVMGRYDAKVDLVTVGLVIPQKVGPRETVVVQYEFSHWMSQHGDPTE